MKLVKSIPDRLNRRSFLGVSSMALVSLSACSKNAGCRGGAAEVRKNPSASNETNIANPAKSLSEVADIGALAEQIKKSERSAVFDVASAAIQSGATYETLLGAACLAGATEISPQRPGGKLHAVMAIESAFQLAENLDKVDALRLALWCIDDVKAGQQRDIEEGDWKLEPAQGRSFSDTHAARNELTAALKAWEPERADQAIVGLVGLLGKEAIDEKERDALFEVIWPFAARSFTGAGHKTIHVSLLERVLRRLGWRHAEPILRTMTAVLLAKPEADTGTDAYDWALPRVMQIKDGWLGGKNAPEQSMTLVRALRRGTMKDAQTLVIDAFSDGLSPATVWDGLRLFAAELFLRRQNSRPADRGSALFPVHGVTVCEAIGHAYRSTAVENTKRLLVLQAAGFLHSMREAFIHRVNLRENGPWLDELAADGHVPNVPALLEEPTPSRARGLLEGRPDDRKELKKALSSFAARKTVEHHQLKYAAAMLGEAERVDPRWMPHIIAPALPYVPMSSDAQTEVGECIDRALKSAGIL